MKTNYFNNNKLPSFGGLMGFVLLRFPFAVFLCAAIAFAGCSGDDDPESEPVITPSLSVAPASIPAAVAAGTYSIAITSNVAWTATVSSGATWCTLTGASGNANGTVTVNVTENLTFAIRSATVTVSAGTLTKTVAVTQAAAAPILEVDNTAIPATADADSYDIAVTSNTAWTATVSEGATWCTLAGTPGSGDGTVTVNVALNAATVTRSATVTLAAGTLTRAVGVAQAALTTPPNAASTQTWVFGEQTWSDAIQIPDCNKTDFTNDYNNPQCRSYTSDKLRYYYNWAYVNQNAATLCPSPWRVPSQADFNMLVSNTTASTLHSDWGFGGYCMSSGSVSYQGTSAYYWSSTENSSSTNNAYFLSYTSSIFYSQDNTYKNSGLQVRCVL
jgi:hypothetical protein